MTNAIETLVPVHDAAFSAGVAAGISVALDTFGEFVVPDPRTLIAWKNALADTAAEHGELAEIGMSQVRVLMESLTM